MIQFECRHCGAALELADGFPEGGAFVCGRCGIDLWNTPECRALHWDALTPLERSWGEKRRNIYGGLIGAYAWPVMWLILAVVGGAIYGRLQTNLINAAVLIAPYFVGAWLFDKLTRGRPHHVLRSACFVFGGLYFVFLGCVVLLAPLDPIWPFGFGGNDGAFFVGFGLMFSIGGVIEYARGRRHYQSLPRIEPHASVA